MPWSCTTSRCDPLRALTAATAKNLTRTSLAPPPSVDVLRRRTEVFPRNGRIPDLLCASKCNLAHSRKLTFIQTEPRQTVMTDREGRRSAIWQKKTLAGTPPQYNGFTGAGPSPMQLEVTSKAWGRLTAAYVICERWRALAVFPCSTIVLRLTERVFWASTGVHFQCFASSATADDKAALGYASPLVDAKGASVSVRMRSLGILASSDPARLLRSIGRPTENQAPIPTARSASRIEPVNQCKTGVPHPGCCFKASSNSPLACLL